ncbi:serine hydrolase domain-containing protein [Wenyingzhuangia aestuarii]|uniref:serine hydrolase domain-containing protein n=1 Tax=Wenyingzhuangia aestuarii TaxID=1647582 RepID=UPI00143B81AF|nr:serine hydrolase [Wenyingzhuangia aestuarii]NJB82165.1 CubicO group peptidase (beta-lactamase class C family) [Wenyingzhuangia aestuarii]
MKILKMIGISLFIIVLIVLGFNYPKLKLISGFTAKNMASSYFLAKRSVDYTNKTDNHGPLTKVATTVVNETSKTAIATVFGMSSKKAVYREGVGAVLVAKESDLTSNYLKPNRDFTPINKPYPYGNLAPEKHTFQNIDYKTLDSLTGNCFIENHPDGIKQTRSILVLYKGKIISEKYAKGFDEHSLLQGWSITKSLVTTCFGVLEKDQKFNIHNPITDFSEWLQDDRKNITTSHLLRMESGLEWEENYSKICDVTKMLFEDTDVTKRPLSMSLKHNLETEFNYSSGTSNILSALLKKQFKTAQEYIDYPYQKLIDKIGMHSMVLETDLANNYVASSYSWATTRDWAKFGQLMLNNGTWNNEQILSPNWIQYISTPNKTSKGEYGGQWWLNHGNYMPNVPTDCFYADGYQGQRIFVIPSKDLVVVRFGVTQLGRVGFYPLFDRLIGDICNTIE